MSEHIGYDSYLQPRTAIKEQRDDWILTGIEVKEETENDLIRFRPKWAYIKKAPIKDKAGTEAKLNM